MQIGAKARQARPGLEALEGRQLLSGDGLASVQAQAQPAAPTPATRVTPLRRVQYTAPGGARVTLQVFGVGNLNGTTLDRDGALNLRFSGTNQETGILSEIVGGAGRAPLRSVQSLNLPAGSLSGVGGNLVDIVDLKGFNLVPGGRINLTSGVHVLDLNAAAADTQINLREVPENTTVTTAAGGTSTTISTGTTTATGGTATGLGTTTTTNGAGTSFGGTNGGGTTIGGVTAIGGTTTGGLTTTGGGLTGGGITTGGGVSTIGGGVISGGTTSGGGTGSGGGGTTTNGGTTTTGGGTTSPISTVGTSTSGAILGGTSGDNTASIGQSFTSTAVTTTTTGGLSTTTTVLPASTTRNGQTLTYSYTPSGGQTLSGVTGRFVPGANIVLQNITFGSPNPQPGAPPAPPGVKIAINAVNGPARGTTLLGDAQVYGYDPVAGALIRFDTVTGAQVQSIPVSGVLPDPKTEAGVALAQVNNTLLVLLSDGANVYAFRATDGAPAGRFSLSALKTAPGPAHPLRLGTVDNATVVSDPAGGASGLGSIQPIDVPRSLQTGQARRLLDATGNPVPAYSLTRAFGLSGGLSGVAGSPTLYATGGGVFDPFQPNQSLLGLSSLGFGRVPTGVTSFGETSRTSVTGLNGQAVPTNTAGATGSALNDALGSVDQNLALFTGQATTAAGGTVDTVTLINPASAAERRTITLDDPNPLTSLSGSFRPALAGAALVDVQGNTQSFKADSTRGLIFSGEGNVNLVKIHRAADTVIVGYPFGHVQVPDRTNVTIVSSARSVGTRNGVVVLPGIKPTGPLSLPTA